MKCGKGSRASYAWRSILFGRELLNKGLMKSIGDGKDTYVWSEKWIMEDIPRRPVNKQVTMDVNLKVEALIQENGQWNKESVQNLFPMNEMTRIFQLPVGQTPDRLIWAYTSHGSYTVKSGYQLASRDKDNKARQLASSEQGVLELKQDIWKVPTIPKIRSFMWRAASGALAVTERLNTRGMQLNTTCNYVRQVQNR